MAEAVPLEGRDVLEVGCGRGGGAAYVVDRSPPRSRSASTSPERDRAGRRDTGRAGVELVEGDAEALPFGDGRFDAVLNVESAHW